MCTLRPKTPLKILERRKKNPILASYLSLHMAYTSVSWGKELPSLSVDSADTFLMPGINETPD